MIFIILLAIAAGGILTLSLSSYKLSKRNDIRARARALAESEMEILFYKYKEFLITGQVIYANDIPDKFAALGSTVYACDNSDTPSAQGTPYTKFYQDTDALDTNNLEKDDWIVRRSISVSVIDPSASGTDKYVIRGTIPNTTKTGKFSYLVARIVVEPGPTSPLYGKVSVKIGRRMSYATASIFQYNVFAQGDLEFAPGGNTEIKGDIAANGSIYMGASSGGTLRVSGYVHYLNGNFFNTTDDGSTTTYRKPGTLAPDGSAVVADSSTLSAPIFTSTGGQTAQVQVMDAAENLLGGLDAPSIAENNQDLFGPAGSDGHATADAINNVYRSIIAPPPDVVAAVVGSHDSSSSEYPSTTTLSTTYADNDSISALRAYNRAGLIITVNTSGTVVSIKSNDGTDYTSSISPAVSSSTVYDQREGKNVAVTQINVGTLKTALDALAPTSSGGSGLNFNGLVYVYLGNSSPTTPAAVRLTNGATTPGASTGAGFSVATNGGLYVKGDYNTVASDGSTVTDTTPTNNINPTMLMADSVTVLSNAWSDSNSTANGNTTPSSAIASRVASTGTASTETTINAGILTGNVSAQVAAGSTPATASGGGQNLVRFLEDWTGKSVTFRGSLGRLFDSKHFTGGYQQPGNVYKIPGLRTFAPNLGLKTATVPGQPLITYFSRGDFFTW